MAEKHENDFLITQLKEQDTINNQEHSQSEMLHEKMASSDSEEKLLPPQQQEEFVSLSVQNSSDNKEAIQKHENDFLITQLKEQDTINNQEHLHSEMLHEKMASSDSEEKLLPPQQQEEFVSLSVQNSSNTFEKPASDEKVNRVIRYFSRENKKLQKKLRTSMLLLILSFIFCLGSLTGISIYSTINTARLTKNINQLIKRNQSFMSTVASDGNLTTEQVVELVSNSVVTVVANGIQGMSGGSGVVYYHKDEIIYIITNAHVVGNATQVFVYPNDLGRDSAERAEVMASDDVRDLAVLKISRSKNNYTPVHFANAEDVKLGQKALAIGSPGSGAGSQLNGSVTEGIISGLDRNIPVDQTGQRMQKFIQTDAAINPGNSGGALVNQYGKLIGINTAKINAADNVGFAIPVDVIEQILAEFGAPAPTK